MPKAKPAASNPEDADTKAMEMIKASGILNPHVTLDKVMDLTRRLAEATADPNLRRQPICIFWCPDHFLFRS